MTAQAFDMDNDGRIDAMELGELLELMGRDRSEGLTVLPDGVGYVSFSDFYELMLTWMADEEDGEAEALVEPFA